MRREHLFFVIMIFGTFATLAGGTELFVRLVADDGMRYDLEMWKYATDVKRLARNPQIGHEHRPGSEARLMGVEFKINSKGLRDREIPYERTPSVGRILMLGDSYTVGWGVPADQTFSKRIERLYAARGITKEVINTGVGNYNTFMEVNYFLDEGYRYQPDIVVLNYVPNDAEPLPSYPRGINLIRVCSACVFVLGRVDTLLREASVRPSWDAYALDLYGDGAKGWLEAKASIKRLAEYTKSHQMKLLIAYLPDLREMRRDPLQRVGDLLRRAAEENGASFVSALPELQSEQEEMKLWVTPTDAHPNARGNELIAGALFRALEANP